MSNKILHIMNVFLILLLLSSCAQSYLDVIPLKPQYAKANWFKTSKKFTHFNYNQPDSKYIIHPFFDLPAYLTKKDQGVNMVVLTPEGSEYQYSLDLKSGRPYKKREYCAEKDIWETFKGMINTPPFSMGFIPRYLDQRGRPQKIILYGDKRYLPEQNHNITSSVRVRIVGSVIEQYCNQYPCTKKSRWLSSIILIAINPNDPQFQNIVHLEELKKIIDYKKMRAFLENGSGRNIKASKPLPSYRVIGGTGANDAISSMREKGHYFERNELTTLKKSCHSIYNYLWNKTQDIKTNILQSKNTSNGDFLDVSREEFAGFIYKFSKLYKKRFMLCQKYVRAASINDNIKRLWFMAYINAFYSMEEIGEIYSCKHKTWLSNPYLASGKRSYSFLRELENCTTDDLNTAFYKVVNTMRSRQGSYMEYKRFITYDNSFGASHQKLYSWAKEDSNLQGCAKTKNFKNKIIFPHNVEWDTF